MKLKPAVALISLSALENIALKEICRSIPGVRIESFADFESFNRLSDKFQYYITDAEIYVVHSDFFLPRKVNTLIVCRSSHGMANKSHPKFFTPDMDQSMVEALMVDLLQGKKHSDETSEISLREREIIREVAAGYTNKEIAEHLFISVNTVTTHRKNISSKLGIRSASGLSLYAIMNGLI